LDAVGFVPEAVVVGLPLSVGSALSVGAAVVDGAAVGPDVATCV
jgi:hypothetical protein